MEVKKERAESERVSNDTGRKDLDEHVEFRLSWPAEMMRIPAKLPSRRTQISSIHSRLAPASNAAAEDGISYTVVTKTLKRGSRGAKPSQIPSTAPSPLAPPPEMAGLLTLGHFLLTQMRSTAHTLTTGFTFLKSLWKRIRRKKQLCSILEECDWSTSHTPSRPLTGGIQELLPLLLPL